MGVLKNGLKILFIGKTGDEFSKKAAVYLEEHFTNATCIFSKRTDSFPENLVEWEGDLLISYLAQWIIPGELLEKASMAAINFHPGPPDYPGIGCTNFAVYHKEKEFGITCHHMLAKVDTGAIIAVKRFPVAESDTVYTITQNCYQAIYNLFIEIMEGVISGADFPVSHEHWTRKPYTRKQLNALCLLSPDMDPDEIKLRLKATTFGNKVWAQVVQGEDKIPYSIAVEKGLI